MSTDEQDGHGGRGGPDEAPGRGEALGPVGRLVAEGIARFETGGETALDELCAAHPELADELRARFEALSRAGLLAEARPFGRYRILGTLGRGGMGVVHLAHDEVLDRRVALKTLPDRLGASERAMARLRREISAIAQLDHPAIVPVRDVGQQDGTPFFTMDYVPGVTLDDELERLRDAGVVPQRLEAHHLGGGRWGDSWIAAACRIVAAVADGLEHAHARGVVHCDVKPGNILLGDDGRARLLDFGLARLDGAGRVTRTGDFAGTPFYVSPEQVRGGRDELDARSDVFSLGVTLYELLTLDRPFRGPSTEAVLRQIATREPAAPRHLNPTVPRDLETICLHALEKEPARRYASAAAMADDLRRVLAFRPVAARRPGTAARALRTLRRHRARTAAAGLALLLAVGAPLGAWVARAAVRAEEQRTATEHARAEAEAQRASAAESRALETLADHEAWRRRAGGIDQFLLSMLLSREPGVDDRSSTAVEILRRGAEHVGAAFGDDALVEAKMRVYLGRAMGVLDLTDEAVEQYTTAWRRLAALDGDEAELVRYQVLHMLTAVLVKGRRIAEAERACTLGLALARRLHGDDSPAVTSLLHHLGHVLVQQGRRDEARGVFRRVLDRRIAERGPDDPQVADDLWNYAHMLDPEQGIPLAQRASAIMGARRAATDMTAATDLVQSLYMRLDQGITDEEIEQLREVRALQLSRLGPMHDDLASSAVLMAAILQRREPIDWQRMEQLTEEAADIYRHLHPGGDGRLLQTLSILAQVKAVQGRHDDAVADLREALLLVRDGDRPSRAELAAQLADLLRSAGRADEADAVLAQHQPATGGG